MSKLLINENPLVVLPTLAKLIGLQESIVLQQVQYWLSNDKAGVVHDGFKWVHNSYAEWAENFPFWSASYIRTLIQKLEKDGLLISDQFAPNPYDHTKSYRIDYEKLDALLEHQPIDTPPSISSETTTETTSKTANAEKPSALLPLSIENSIAVGAKIESVADDKYRQMIDSANLIATGCGTMEKAVYHLAYTFMKERDIVIPLENAKGNRKAAKSMVQQGVKPEHIALALEKLQGMTVVDLFGVQKTAVAIANPAPESDNSSKFDW